MSPNAQRIVIADATGWHHISFDGPELIVGHPRLQNEPDIDPIPLLDYPNDLNAMHEAEKILNEWEDREYREHLIEITACGEHRATAAQRAEAFLRTLGKWTPAATH